MEPTHPLLRSALASLAFAVLCGIGGKAAAQAEVEPNNSWAGAQVIANLAGPLAITGARSFEDPSDDFFSFSVRGPGLLRIVSSSADGGADSIMGLFDSTGALLASNDDGAGQGSMSVIEYTVGAGGAGTYTLGFSGYNPLLLTCTGAVTQCYDTDDDFAFDTFVAGGGAGGSTGWSYTLDLSGVALVPEPHAALLLGPGLLLLALRRRRR